jgi:ligand-binding sensor protein
MSATTRSNEVPESRDLLPMFLQEQLLDPAIWREGLQSYAESTNLAVALVDTKGQLIGPCLNAKPLWTLFWNQHQDTHCPFCVETSKPCMPMPWNVEGILWAEDAIGLVHFTVPLAFKGQVLAGLVAGQVFNQYPDELRLEKMARKYGLSEGRMWQLARTMMPVGPATLKVYSRLMATLGQTLLQTRYYNLIEADKQQDLKQQVSDVKRAEAEIHELNAALKKKISDYQDVVRELERSKADLQEKVEELEKFADATVGRELKMMDLEREVAKLREVENAKGAH